MFAWGPGLNGFAIVIKDSDEDVIIAFSKPVDDELAVELDILASLACFLRHRLWRSIPIK